MKIPTEKGENSCECTELPLKRKAGIQSTIELKLSKCFQNDSCSLSFFMNMQQKAPWDDCVQIVLVLFMMVKNTEIIL